MRAAVRARFEDHRRRPRTRTIEVQLAPADIERSRMTAGDGNPRRSDTGALANLQARDPMLSAAIDRDIDRELLLLSRLDQGDGRSCGGVPRKADDADRSVVGRRLLDEADDLRCRDSGQKACCKVSLYLRLRERRGVVVDLRKDPCELLPNRRLGNRIWRSLPPSPPYATDDVTARVTSAMAVTMRSFGRSVEGRLPSDAPSRSNGWCRLQRVALGSVAATHPRLLDRFVRRSSAMLVMR